MNKSTPEIVSKEINSEDLKFLDDQIYAFNAAATKQDNGQYFSRLIYDGLSVVAGLTGWTWAGACEIEILWVHQDWRGRGYGRLLLEAAEAEAKAQNCRVVLIHSYSFQAPEFYQKHGYRVEWELADFPPGHRHTSLVKRW